MTRYLLDTNIVSDATKPTPSVAVTDWLSRQADENLHISSLTIAEIWRGVVSKPAGKRRDQLEAWFSGAEGPDALFAGRILSFDKDAAIVWGNFMAQGAAAGQPRSILDTMIAAIAQANDCVVVTANEKDFAGVEFINPTRLPSP